MKNQSFTCRGKIRFVLQTLSHNKVAGRFSLVIGALDVKSGDCVFSYCPPSLHGLP